MDRNALSHEGKVPALLKHERGVAPTRGHHLGPSTIAGCRAAVVLALALHACGVSVNWRYPRTPSTAFTEPQTTSVGALMQAVAARHQGLSGVLPIPENRDAFMARLAMADLAERTLDAQYYIWDSDTTGKILGERLLRAADRGVRVRVLIDDHYMTKVRDTAIAILAGHPNLEVRFFNPVTNRESRTMSFLREFSRVNHRMHNKLFIIDDALGIVGGRNIGDVYFGVEAQYNYRDLDVLAAGPIVNDLSVSFDLFWNSAWAIPVGAVVSKLPTQDELREIRMRTEEHVAATGYPYPIYESTDDLRARLVRARDRLIWAPAHVLVEHPSRVATDASRVIVTALAQRMEKAEHEVSIESPYFVLRKRGMEIFRTFLARGGKVRVLTNSAASTDVLPAQAGYANTRNELLHTGVDLYELRPDTNMKRTWSILAWKSTAALHAKTMVFDRQSVWIGSFNLDPRSIGLNTEVGLMIDSPEIAAQVAELMDGGVAPGSAYHVTLDEKGDLLWTTQVDGQEVRYHSDPTIGFWRRLQIGILRLLPMQEEL